MIKVKLSKKLKEIFTKDACYTRMETAGVAFFSMCPGVMGGDRSTEYLAYSCISCKYNVSPERMSMLKVKKQPNHTVERKNDA